jgi:GTP cyclohydrolase I
MFVREVFSGRYESAPTVTEFSNVEHLDELLIVGPLRVRSACSHYLCPIMGRVWIGVMPHEYSNLIGLSKYGRLVNWVMSRPQITEEAVKQVADLLENRIVPDGLASCWQLIRALRWPQLLRYWWRVCWWTCGSRGDDPGVATCCPGGMSTCASR